MVLAIEPGIYWEGGGGLRLEDNFLSRATEPEKLGSVPGRDRSMSDPRDNLDGRSTTRLRLEPPDRSASTTRRCATASRPSASCLDPQHKLEIAHGLAELGVDRIEAGFPRVSEDDAEAVG